MGRRGAAITLVVAMAVAAGCTSTDESTSKEEKRAAGRQAGAGPGPGAWRVAESVRLTPTSVLYSVAAVDAAHAWAVGADGFSPTGSDRPGVPVVVRWDGRAWSREKLPDRLRPGLLELVAADSPANVWAVGGYASPQGDNAYLMLRFDGTAWREVPFPPLATRSTDTRITGLAVAGGHTWLVGHQDGKVVIQEWDGRAWRAHRPPAPCDPVGAPAGHRQSSCELNSVVAFAPDDVWVGGSGAWPGFQGPVLFHWGGAAWHNIDTGTSQQKGSFQAVNGRSSGELWAVGSRYDGSRAVPLVVRRDGDSWRVVDGMPDGALRAVAVSSTGHPWVISNREAPGAMLMTYGTSSGWAGDQAPTPPDALGITLSDITAMPGSDRMFAVGELAVTDDRGRFQAVILERS